MESILEIADLVINQQYATALGKIEQQLSISASEAEHHHKLVFYRALCHIELGEHDQALKDLDACESSLGKSGKWFYRYAECQFMTEDFPNALIYFKRASESDDIKDEGLKNRIQRWINKTQLELGNPYIGNINEEIFLKSETPVESATASSSKPEESKAPTSTDGVQSIDSLNPDWYQNNDFVFVSILKKKLKGEANVSLSASNAEITFPSGERFAIHLANSIDTENSTYTQTEKKIEIKLKKRDQGIVWSALSREQVSQTPQDFKPSYPSSNPKKKNWDDVNRGIDREFMKEKPEGDEAMNDLLKQIYSGADEETRRAMIKSYQTSNGTVLSTNWGEVKEKDYEGKDYVAPPDHFEARKPEL